MRDNHWTWPAPAHPAPPPEGDPCARQPLDL